jgi:hypothetical protein
MRVSTAHTYDLAIESLQKRQNELATSQGQLTTGKKVNVPSDDPIAAARAERALATIGRADANQRALDASRNVLQIAESSMADAVELIQQARESLVAAGNASYTDSERKSVAKKLTEIRSQLLTVANRADGGGGFVFGGQGSATPPFLDATGGVQFIGQGGEAKAPAGESMNLTVDGETVWLFEQLAAGIGQHPAHDLGMVVQLFVPEQINHRARNTGFGIGGGKHHTLEACMHQGHGTHGAWLQGDEQFALRQAIVFEQLGGVAQGHDLGVCGRVMGGDGAVIARGNHLALAHDHRPHRHLTGQPGVVGLVQRNAHGMLVTRQNQIAHRFTHGLLAPSACSRRLAASCAARSSSC